MWVRGLKHKIDVILLYGLLVAPYVGAWIETPYKYFRLALIGVAPYVGAWIETPSTLAYCPSSVSHPMWVRGLKLVVVRHCLKQLLSHPMWVRGLKLCAESGQQGKGDVAPYVGAWIET